MPTITVNDVTMYYEIHGEVEPLVLIGGLTNDVSDYTGHTTIIADLAQHFTVIALDNRGAGRASKPDIPYTVGIMAEDTLGINRVHVL
jgi:pimeloyl-ACP methyl ester carboxylesterase